MAADDARMRAAADRLLERLRELAAGIDDDERMVLAALLAPGVADAYGGEAEVVGYGGADESDVGWAPGQLSTHLAGAIRDRGLRIVER